MEGSRSPRRGGVWDGAPLFLGAGVLGGRNAATRSGRHVVWSRTTVQNGKVLH